MKFSLILKYFLIWQLFLVVISPLLLSRANFDGNNYISISINGHGYAQQAFFPLYPSLIRYVRSWFNPSDEQRVQVSAVIGVTISVISFVGALWFLDKLVRLDYSVKVSRLAIMALLLFPTSFFFTAVYTESIFFFFLISSFYFARTRKWWLAGVLAGLASYTRFIGIFIFPALVVEMWQQGVKKNILPLLLAPMGLATYMYFLQRTTGNAFSFWHGSDRIVLLYQVFWRYVKMIATVRPGELIYVNIVFEAFVGLIFLITSVFVFFKQRSSYAIFNLAAYLVPTLTGSFVSLPRYVLICFPSFIILANLLAKNKKLGFIYLLISGCLLAVYWVMFSRGQWVG